MGMSSWVQGRRWAEAEERSRWSLSMLCQCDWNLNNILICIGTLPYIFSYKRKHATRHSRWIVTRWHITSMYMPLPLNFRPSINYCLWNPHRLLWLLFRQPGNIIIILLIHYRPGWELPFAAVRHTCAGRLHDDEASQGRDWREGPGLPGGEGPPARGRNFR